MTQTIDNLPTLDTIMEGALLDRFQSALLTVLANIDDPNTEHGSIRKIKMIVSFKPDAERVAPKMKISVDTVLAPDAPLERTVFAGTEKGQYVMYDHNPNQLRLGVDDTSGSN